MKLKKNNEFRLREEDLCHCCFCTVFDRIDSIITFWSLYRLKHNKIEYGFWATSNIYRVIIQSTGSTQVETDYTGLQTFWHNRQHRIWLNELITAPQEQDMWPVFVCSHGEKILTYYRHRHIELCNRNSSCTILQAIRMKRGRILPSTFNLKKKKR